MKPVVFTVVHPEEFFFHWEGEDSSWRDIEYKNIFPLLKNCSYRALASGTPLITIHKIPFNLSHYYPFFLTLDSLVSQCLQRSDLALLDSAQKNPNHFYTGSHAVPYPSVLRENKSFRKCIKRYPLLFVEDTYVASFAPYAEATHLLAGATFSRSLANWGHYLKKTFPEADVVYIDELCMEWSAEKKDSALQRIASFGGRVVSYDEALSLFQRGE